VRRIAVPQKAASGWRGGQLSMAKLPEPTMADDMAILPRLLHSQ
jgi:hypothetical protein